MDYSGLKVLFVTSSLTSGGAEKVMSILASECAELGLDTSLVIMTNKEVTYPVSDKVKCYFTYVDKGKLKTVKSIFKFRKVLKEIGADVVVPFLPSVSLYTMVAGAGIKKKLITSERADPNISLRDKRLTKKNKIVHVIMRRLELFSLADYMVFQTPDAQSYYSKKLQKKSTVIPNPLDIAALPERFEGEREKKIVAAGRFSEEKNFPMLIRAFARFRKEFPDYTLELYGEGELRGQLETLCKELDIEKSVLMPGFVGDLADRMVNAAMYISTSNHEGISNSMLEALGMGVPTIVTDCPVGGAKMFVKTDENGVLIDMEDEEALFDAIVKIASDKEYAEKISFGATQIRQELSAKKITEKWIEVFGKVCSK